MNELERIAREADALRAAGTAYLLATVVRVEGSSYRRPGARMLVADGRWLAGSVSGGCLEGDVLLRGEHRTRGGAAVVVTYDSTSDDELRWGFGLGCNGVVDVLLERVAAGDDHPALAFARRCFEGQRAGSLVTVFRSDDPALPVGTRLTGDEPRVGVAGALLAAAARPSSRARVVSVGGVTALVETVAPSPHLFVLGGGHDAVPLVSLARGVGFAVVVVDGRERSRARFAEADAVVDATGDALRARLDAAHEAYVVVMSHDVDRDRASLAVALASRARYIGVLGPAARTQRLLAALAAEGGAPDETSLARVHAPVGLDLGAETPEEIALAILAEAEAVGHRTRAASLREGNARPIHARPACAVLAAGASRRLGRPKQLVAFRGTTLLRRVAAQCVEAGVGPVAVVLGASATEIAPTLDGLAVTARLNDAWPEGVASSVRAAVAWAEETGAAALLLVLGDQALVTAAHLARLEAAWRAGARAVGSRFGGVLGAPALFDRALWPELAALTGDRGAGRLLREGDGVAAVDWPEGACDVDTEADVRALASDGGPSAPWHAPRHA